MIGRACLAAIAALSICAPPDASAEARFAVIVSGASGGGKYATQQAQWRDDLVSALRRTFGFLDVNVVVLADDGTGTSRATAENVRRVLGDLGRRVTKDDTVLLVLFGHGTFDGADAKFNLVGPDLTAKEWNALIGALAGRTVLINTTASSFPFLEELSRQGRVVITATDSSAQRFATVFPGYFVQALADPASDLDKDRRFSVWEAFVAASAAVKRHYEQRGQLSTERPLLDDDGDRVGREAEAPGDDGVVARGTFLDAPAGSAGGDEALAALERRRRAIEAGIEALKVRKPSMPADQYTAELERLLLELSRIAQEIRQRS